MPSHTTRSDLRLLTQIAGLCSLGAALVHAVVMPNHWEEWWASGAFFAALAAFQGVWGVLAVVRPRSRWLLTAAVAVNLGAAGLWGLSRFWAVPAGPAAGTTEQIGVAGLGATLLGILTALLAAWALLPRIEQATVSRGWHAGALGTAAVVVALVAAPAAIAGPSHSHDAGSHGESHEGPSEDGHHEEPVPSTTEPSQAPSPTSEPTPSPTAPETGTTTDGHHDDEPHAH